MSKPVYALVGADAFLQMEKLREILRQFPKDADRIDVDGDKAELSQVLDELRSFAMFGGAKVVIVREADEFISRYREQLEDYLAQPSDSGTLILRVNSLPANQRIHKLIQKVGQIEVCAPPKDRELAAWITQRAKQAHDVSLSQAASALLAELIGNDLGRVDSELAKLALQVDKQKIDADDIQGSVAFQREQQMWDMTNEIAAGKTAEALSRWRHLVQLDSSAEFRAVTWLGMWLEKVRQALALKKKGMQPFAIAQQLKLWPKEIQGPFFETAQAMGEEGVARAMDWLVEVDHHSKSGRGNAVDNVERFLLSVGNLIASREPASRG